MSPTTTAKTTTMSTALAGTLRPFVACLRRGCSSTQTMSRRLVRGATERPKEARKKIIFAANLLLLRATGFWRLAGDGLGGGLGGGDRPSPRASAAQHTFFYANVACNVAFLFCKLVHTAGDTSSLRSVTENVSDLLCIFFDLSQLCVLLYCEAKVVGIMLRIDHQFWRLHRVVPSCRENLSRWERRGRRHTLSTFLFFLFTGLSFALIVSVTGNKKHSLPIPIWTPFSQADVGILGPLLLVEAVGVILTVAGSGAISALFINCLLAVQGQVDVVRRYFEMEAAAGLPDGAWGESLRESVRERLVVGAKLHQSVMDLADDLCGVLSPFLACQLSTIVFMICIALFQISMNPLDVRNIRFIALCLNVAVEAYIICWMGTRLSDEAKNVQLGLESTNWHLQGKEIGRIVKFITMRAQKAPYVVVGSYVHVGLPAFLEMIRSSYSLLAFLQKRARKEIS